MARKFKVLLIPLAFMLFIGSALILHSQAKAEFSPAQMEVACGTPNDFARASQKNGAIPFASGAHDGYATVLYIDRDGDIVVTRQSDNGKTVCIIEITVNTSISPTVAKALKLLGTPSQ